MHRRFFVCIALSGVLLRAATAAAAQNAAAPAASAVNISLYAGDTANLTLGAWGSGRAEAVTEPALIGGQSIRVTTQGLYQGARIDLKTPVDLTPAFANPQAYLRFQLRFTGTGATQPVYDPATGETRRSVASPFNWMRFLLTMADGTRHELIRPVEVQGSDDPDSWLPVAFPVGAILKKPGGQSLPAPAGEGARLAQIAVFGDRYEQFYVGEIGVLTDDTEILVDPLEEQIAFVGDQLTFAATAEGGASTLRYSWDFDGDKQEDRTGRVAQYYWRKPGKYPVTLTVSDVDGLKKPATATVTIDVAE